MKNGYKLVDTFNDRVISRHRTERGACKASAEFFRAFRRNNSQGSYLPTQIIHIVDGVPVGTIIYEVDYDGISTYEEAY